MKILPKSIKPVWNLQLQFGWISLQLRHLIISSSNTFCLKTSSLKTCLSNISSSILTRPITFSRRETFLVWLLRPRVPHQVWHGSASAQDSLRRSGKTTKDSGQQDVAAANDYNDLHHDQRWNDDRRSGICHEFGSSINEVIYKFCQKWYFFGFFSLI